MTIIISYLDTYGRGCRHVLTDPWDTIVMTVISLGVYYWGVNTGLPEAIIPEFDPEED